MRRDWRESDICRDSRTLNICGSRLLTVVRKRINRRRSGREWGGREKEDEEEEEEEDNYDDDDDDEREVGEKRITKHEKL
ncbi:Hypothetical predicted protein [Octopus vulgaris]|uniref:Uncharacterized protein n=1 Tax=Octopus vulgaris TaxID=6645 RepID=A0AA36B1Y3_OCTVU|nr:Hypothetical predicted protein [Octopus vulgaris]